MENLTIKEHIAGNIAGIAEKELLKWNNNTILTGEEIKEHTKLYQKYLQKYFDNNKDAFSSLNQ